jgi:hypothetical protein
VVNVRADGIAVVLGPLLSDARITAAALVDVDSGMVLDAWSAPGPGGDPADPADPAVGAPDLEMLGAQHAEVVRCALALLAAYPHPGGSRADACEVVLGTDGGHQHLLRTVPDPHGDRLALAVVVDGPPRVLDRVRKRLRSVSVDALTAGPSMTRRPVFGGWSFAMPRPDVPAGIEQPARASAAAPADPSPAPSPPAAAPAAQLRDPVPALAGLDGGHLELPVPRGGQPGPESGVPAPAVPHLRSVRPDPVPGPVVPRRPSPPAALPAPAPPRRPV